MRNRAERDYPILEELEISNEFLNADDLDISILEASGIAVPENPHRLFKVRPMVNTLNVLFQSIPASFIDR